MKDTCYNTLYSFQNNSSTCLAGITLEQYFSTVFNEGYTYNMVQLFELCRLKGCHAWFPAAAPNGHVPAVGPGSHLPGLCILYGNTSKSEVFRQLNKAHGPIWDAPPECLFVI